MRDRYLKLIIKVGKVWADVLDLYQSLCNLRIILASGVKLSDRTLSDHVCVCGVHACAQAYTCFGLSRCMCAFKVLYYFEA